MNNNGRQWCRVTKKFRCRICNHDTWCTFTSDLEILCCMRVESKIKMGNGGWLHRIDGSKAKEIVKMAPKPQTKTDIDAPYIIGQMAKQTSRSDVERHAKQLGVSAESLLALGCSWSNMHKAWAFPMHNGQGDVIGIRLRDETGRKWAVSGSKTGIFIPKMDPQDVLYVCEGPTDTAAAVTMGIFAVGKPDCMHGDEYIATLCRRFMIGRVVVVADNDGPGLKGGYQLVSEKLKGFWRKIWTPPVKDLREMLSLGADADMVRGSVNGMRWITP